MRKRRWYEKFGRWLHDMWLCHRWIFARKLKEELDSAYMEYFPNPVKKERDESGRELYYRLGFIHAVEFIAKRMDIPLNHYFGEGPDR